MCNGRGGPPSATRGREGPQRLLHVVERSLSHGFIGRGGPGGPGAAAMAKVAIVRSSI